ncbi:hypothetical protein CPB84DRAFT_1549663 [Gymnopilus junonius]|uniref:Uncharacterized protein n=1 Tax=Gymnopilus junonius TaxID=109634 RepID=A0A9P5N6F4_GYMJU|nr:hypothetical protein CPB84DRAFT_1549663 [Gymnopilus junonius]
MQKEMKDEMERLKTQFLFKQQELESTMRKPPGTIRAKKVNKEFPSTPLAGSTGMTAWNRDSSQAQVSWGVMDETPVRPRPLHIPRQSPSKHARKSPEKTRKSAKLPGFENAFDTSTPLRPSLRRDKGKERADQDLPFGDTISNIPYMHSQPIPVPSELQPQFISSQILQQETSPGPTPGPSAIFEPFHTNVEELDIMPAEPVETILEEFEEFEPADRKAELCRVLLTHSYSSTSEISLQKLLSSVHFINSESANNYSASCARILAVIASSTNEDDYEHSIQAVCMALLSLLIVLHESQQLHLMTILLDLLVKLVLYFSCQIFLLSARPSLKGGQTVSMIDLLCHFILDYLDPAKSIVAGREFAVQIFSLLESFCFRVPQECVSQLDVLARHKRALMLLLHTSQPSWFLERSSILLALLSTHHELSAALLDCRELKDPNSNMEYDQRKNPFIERLCWHLIDSTRNPIEKFKIYILGFFSQLSTANSDAYTELVDTYALIPSLISYTSQLATPLWEDDESLLMSSKVATSFVQALDQTTFLLHQLIFEADPCLNVRLKLHQAPHRPFNGIDHMFVVTFGRLSYCDPPSWLDLDDRQSLTCLVDIAREILEVVIDGPEIDSVWAAFESVHDEESAIDEGEMEARLMGIEI